MRITQKIVVTFIMLRLMTDEIAGSSQNVPMHICGGLGRSPQMIICDLSGKIRLYINNDGAGIRCTVACLFVLEHVYQAIFPASNRTYDASSLCILSHANLVFLTGNVNGYTTIIRGNFNSMKTPVCLEIRAFAFERNT